MSTTWIRTKDGASLRRLVDSYGFISGHGVILTIVAGCFVLCGAVYGGRAYGRTYCRHFGTQTGFPTKFVVLNWADSGQCLAQAPNGRWVKNTQIVQFVQANR